MKVHKQTVISGNKIRIIENKNGEFQAQIKRKDDSKFHNYGNSAETFDHACYWALEAIEFWFQDGRAASK